jgi:hypothetical protein
LSNSQPTKVFSNQTLGYVNKLKKSSQSVYFTWNNQRNAAEIVYFTGKGCKGEVDQKWTHYPDRCNDYFGNLKAIVSRKPFDEPNKH